MRYALGQRTSPTQWTTADPAIQPVCLPGLHPPDNLGGGRRSLPLLTAPGGDAASALKLSPRSDRLPGLAAKEYSSITE